MSKNTFKILAGFCVCLFLFVGTAIGAEERFGGVGLSVEMRDGELVVLDVMAGTDAAAKNIKNGDIITHIDQTSTRDVDLGTSVARLRGRVDSEVVLEVRRAGVPQPIIFKLTRAEVVYSE